MLVILGFIVTGLAQGMRFDIAASAYQTRLLTEDQALDAIERMLRRLIEQAAPGSEWETLIFTGTPRRVAFTSTVPVLAGQSAGARAEIGLGIIALTI